MNVKQILEMKGRDVFSVQPDITIRDFARLVAEKNIGAAPVTNGNNSLVGVISERDIARGLDCHGDGISAKTVSELMTAEVVSCGPENTISDVVELMSKHGVRHIAVLDGEALTGFISIRDLVFNRLSQLELDNETLRAMLENYDALG
ncbi:MAG: CBS domain-containing protein [Alphaproteobacteria bacterium]